MDEPFLIIRGGRLLVREAVKDRYSVAVPGDSVNIGFPESKTRRGRVGHGVAQTLLTGDEQVVVVERRCVLLGTLRGGAMGTHLGTEQTDLLSNRTESDIADKGRRLPRSEDS